MQDVYRNIDEYNVNKERKMLIVFNDMIVDMINNKKLNSIVTDLFIKTKQLSHLYYAIILWGSKRC